MVEKQESGRKWNQTLCTEKVQGQFLKESAKSKNVLKRVLVKENEEKAELTLLVS